ncbi:MAG: phenylalanine--tRNA ligase subunit beta [Myxococcales bacterium]|nr:phenylalanine--tRNA ligase subunit beta [Myxococcales bacterium]MCB9734409.1 phenylalanine--tRNA ligase subunit beta [Deltaproteobacteria bacterium]
MLISCNWLSRHVDLDGVDLDALAARFTMSVAELDGVHHVGRGLDHVVVGKVLEVSAIEGKKVRLTRVDTGAHGVREIVCGAPNVAAGQTVVVALPGARLGDMAIEVAAVAGITSHGMLASERELGLSDEHAGILVLDEEVGPGTAFSLAFAVEDTLLEIDNKSLTHRPDCWGHRGVAREVAALIGRPLKPLDVDVTLGAARPITVRVDDFAACPRYSAVTMSGVTVAPSPYWMKLLLQRVGVRAINNVVDATNFVMLDLGNPLHAFDRREIGGDAIIVRRAEVGETFTTLDGQVRKLTTADLLIADAERGIALAGVMGGENSEIRADTSEIVLEAANFDAATVRMTSQRLGLRTDASARFEKSLDPLLVGDASRSFCKLLLELCPSAQVDSAFIDVAAPPRPEVRVELPLALVRRRLGVDLSRERIVGILEALAFDVRDAGDDVLDVGVPTFRATKDVGIREDLIEEVGRVYGYDNVPPAPAVVALSQPDPNARKRFEHGVRNYLSLAGGLDEVQTYSFDFEPLLASLGVVPGPRVELRNTLSAESPALRRDLVPHLLGVVQKNTRVFEEVRAYEIGRVFRPKAGEVAEQPVHLGLVVARIGDENAELFFELKALLAGLARHIGRRCPEVVAGGVDAVWAHPVRQGRVVLDGVEVGVVAEAHPRVRKQLELRQGAAVLELDLDAWRLSAEAPAGYRPLPKFPAVYRDFAVVVSEDVPAGTLQSAIRGAAAGLIEDVAFQSIYRGAGLGEGEKSLAWSVTLRDREKTLGDAQVREVEDLVWKALAEVGGRPRA